MEEKETTVPSTTTSGSGQEEGGGGADTATPHVVVVNQEETEVAAVTVYTENMAEVTRIINWTPDHCGLYDLSLVGLTNQLDKDTVRVSSAGGVRILNVAVESTFLSLSSGSSEEEGGKDKEDELSRAKVELEQARDLREKLRQELARLEASLQLVKVYSYSLINADGSCAPRSTTTGATAKAELPDLNTFKQVLDFQQSHAQEVDDRLRQARSEIKEVDSRITSLELLIASRGARPDRDTTHLIPRVTVELALEVVDTKAPVAIEVKYMVAGATWRPSYDLRVEESHGEDLQVQYFAHVSQVTGEDWSKVFLALSTALPSRGGVPPAAGTRYVRLYRPLPVPQPKRKSKMMAAPGAGAAPQMMRMEEASCQLEMQSAECDMLFDAQVPLGMAPCPPEAPTNAMAGTANFKISKRTTVKSDNKPVKVMVASLSFRPAFRHFVVPSKDTSVYLQAKVTNTSSHILMPSTDASIFFGSTFVGKTELKFVAPGESFQTFLGVDPMVKCDYVPTKTLSNTGGMFSRSMSKSFETSYVVTNGKSIEVFMAIVDSLPLADTDKIKVVLQDPTLQSVTTVKQPLDVDVGTAMLDSPNDFPRDPTTYLNKDTNNIVWTMRVAKGAKTTIPFRYSVEWPSNVAVEFT